MRMNRAIFGRIMTSRCLIICCLIPHIKRLSWLRRSLILTSCRLLRLFRCWSSLLLFLFILLLFKLHSNLFRGFFEFLFFLVCIIIKFSFWSSFFSRIGSTWSRFSFLLLNFWRFLFGRSWFRLFLAWWLRFLFLLGLLLLTSFLSLIFRLSVLIASDKFASEPDKEIVYVEPFGTFLRLSKHRVRRIRHLRSNICSIVVINTSTLREMSVRVHIHLIIKRLLGR